jgi:hypothetical protein
MFSVNTIGGRMRGPRISNVLGSLLLATFVSSPVLAAQGDAWTDQLIDGISNGDFDLSLRYRYEWVDSALLEKDANASTLRTRLFYKSAEFKNVFLTLNMDDVRPIVANRFNDTRNGKAQYPLVVDPKGTDLNLASLTWTGLDNAALVLGRQRIIRENARFVGNVGWRQNEQTYDSVSFDYTPIEQLSLFYAYVDRVKRIFGPDKFRDPGTQEINDNGVPASSWRSNSHLVDVAYKFGAPLKLTAYAYLLDFDNAAAASSATYGLRGTGSVQVGDSIKIGYVGEFAAQSDYEDNPVSYDANYYAVEGSLGWERFGFKLGFETLEGDGTPGAKFLTPLATLHKFNGWADQFLVTPDNGLEDAYAEANAKFLKGTWRIIYHDFSANTGGGDYGSEIDFVASWKFGKAYSALIKFASYSSDEPNCVAQLGGTCDLDKVWAQLSADF